MQTLTVENTTRHQFDPGHVNTLLSNNAFTNLNISILE